jgi:hypothetical protein
MALKPIQKVVIISAISIVVLFVAYKIAFPSVKKRKKCDPEKDNCENFDPEDIVKNTDEYIAESFPLVKGMKGDKIIELRTFLGMQPLQYFDQDVEDMLYKKYKVKKVTEYDYNWWKSHLPNITV